MEQEMELRELLSILSRRWKLIISLFFLAIFIAAFLSYFVITPLYEATTRLWVGKPAEGAQVVFQDIQLSRQLVKTVSEIAKSSLVVDTAIADLNLRLDVEEFREIFTVTQVGDTEIIAISVKDSSSERAAFLANGLARALITQVDENLNVTNLYVIESAVVPESPVSPRIALNIAIAGVLAVLAGVSAAFALAYLDNTIKTPQDIEQALGLATLGVIPHYEGRK